MSGGAYKKLEIVVAFVEGRRAGLPLPYIAFSCGLDEKDCFLRAMSYGLSSRAQARL